MKKGIVVPASIRSSSSIPESINSSGEIRCSSFTCTEVDLAPLRFAVSGWGPGGFSGKEGGNNDAGKHGFNSADRNVPADSIQPWQVRTERWFGTYLVAHDVKCYVLGMISHLRTNWNILSIVQFSRATKH